MGDGRVCAGGQASENGLLADYGVYLLWVGAGMLGCPSSRWLVRWFFAPAAPFMGGVVFVGLPLQQVGALEAKSCRILHGHPACKTPAHRAQSSTQLPGSKVRLQFQ